MAYSRRSQLQELRGWHFRGQHRQGSRVYASSRMYGSNTDHGLAITFTSEFKKLATTMDSSKAPKIKKKCKKIVFNYSDSEIIISHTIIMFIFYNCTNVGYNEINFSYFISFLPFI